MERIPEIAIGKNGCVVDHLANCYSTFNAMCSCWCISRSRVRDRLQDGWSLQDALTRGNDVTVPAADTNLIWLLGEPFPNYRAIDDAYGFSYGTSCKHKDNLDSWILEMDIYVHDNVVYRSIVELCLKFKIGEPCLRERLRSGWPLSKALLTPVGACHNAKECSDHLGNTYNSVSDMCRAYDMSMSCYRGRIRKGWSVKDALTVPRKNFLYRSQRIVANQQEVV